MRLTTVLGIGSKNSAYRSTTPLRPRSGAAYCSITSTTWSSMRATARGVSAFDTSLRMRACWSGGAENRLSVLVRASSLSGGGGLAYS